MELEFLKNHNEITAEENKKLEKIAIDQFRIENKNGRTFEKAYQNVSNSIIEVRNKNFISKYSFHFSGFYNIYNKGIQDYGFNVDRILKVLENEVYEKFKDPYVTKKKTNYVYHDDFDVISSSYEKFTSQLLTYVANREFERTLMKHYAYLELKYEFDDFSNVDLNPFEGEIVDTLKYKKTHQKLKPNEPLSVEYKIINAFGNEVIITKSNSNENSPLDNSIKNGQNESTISESKKLILSKEENALLLNIFFQIMREDGFDETAELYKVLSIINVRPIESFQSKNSYRSCIEYKALQGKIKKIDLTDLESNPKSNLKEYYQYLQNLKLNIEYYNLKKINKKIAEIQSNINDILR